MLVVQCDGANAEALLMRHSEPITLIIFMMMVLGSSSSNLQQRLVHEICKQFMWVRRRFCFILFDLSCVLSVALRHREPLNETF